jgi:hypothetical protein
MPVFYIYNCIHSTDAAAVGTALLNNRRNNEIWGSHRSKNEDYSLLGFDTMLFDQQVPTFHNWLLPSSG